MTDKSKFVKVAAFAPSIMEALEERLVSYGASSQDGVVDGALSALIEQVKHLERPQHERLGVRAFLELIQDLVRVGWRFQLDASTSMLSFKPPEIEIEAESTSAERARNYKQIKRTLRRIFQVARCAQFENDDRLISFVRDLEQPSAGGQHRPVTDLFLDPSVLVRDLEDFADLSLEDQEARLDDIIQPYVQVADDEPDSHTGIRLRDIWMYARWTWSMPFSEVPGRRMYFLVRDRARPYHPIIGIGALGSCVMQLTIRDRTIGWSSLAFAANRDVRVAVADHGDWNGKEISRKDLLDKRRSAFVSDFGENVRSFVVDMIRQIDCGIADIYLDDFVESGAISTADLEGPADHTLEALKALEEAARRKEAQEGPGATTRDFLRDAQTPLYRKKRARSLRLLLTAKRELLRAETSERDDRVLLDSLLSNSKLRRAVKQALRCIKQRRVASTVLDITTCGALPPYNTLLGGKLTSLLMASPQVLRIWRDRYATHESVIASRMKGAPIIRDAMPVLLTTTSLYGIGSSQYNRIKVPTAKGHLVYQHIGKSEGFGSSHISPRTHRTFIDLLKAHPDLTLPDSRFGAGVNAKMRINVAALTHLGLPELQQHKLVKRVYFVPVINNPKAYLTGRQDRPEYIYDSLVHPEKETQALIDFWKRRWFQARVLRPEILQSLRKMVPACVTKTLPEDLLETGQEAPLPDLPLFATALSGD